MHLTILNRRAKKVGVVSAHSMKACTVPAVRQLVFADLQITSRQSCSSPSARILVRAFILLAYTIQTLPLIGCS